MKAFGCLASLPVADEHSIVEQEVGKPTASGYDLLVKVEAVSVNPIDTKVRKNMGGLDGGLRILGWDAAGVVEAVGKNVTGFAPGDSVYYSGVINRPGSNAEYQLVDSRIAAKMPKSLSFAEAAALPLTTITAWESMADGMGIKPNQVDKGKTILIIGGAGGVGSVAIQLAKKVFGLNVIATASRPESIAFARKMGADAIIDHRNPLRDELSHHRTDAVDYVLNCVNTAQYHDTIPVIIRPFGTVVNLVDVPQNVTLNMNPYKQKCIRFAWEFMFARPFFGTDDMQKHGDVLSQVAELIDAGQMQTTMREHFGALTAENIRRAHGKLESGTMIGKVVLGVD